MYGLGNLTIVRPIHRVRLEVASDLVPVNRPASHRQCQVDDERDVREVAADQFGTVLFHQIGREEIDPGQSRARVGQLRNNGAMSAGSRR